MNNTSRRFLIWTGIALVLFVVFRWLFGLAIPGAALAFSIGITVILIAGLISGWYVPRVWFHNQSLPGNMLFAVLSLIILLAFVGIGFFVNKMIGDTQFFDFSITVLLLFLLSSCGSAIISLTRIRIRHRLHTAQINFARSESELQLLQSRLSPHFLFNTLNNLYGLSLTDPKKVPSLLLRLSDLLRYSIYDTREMFVPLQLELDYLNNYIEFEKVRLGMRLDLSSNLLTVHATDIKIAPMLLVVFVENAFKHSRNSVEEKILIDIRLEINDHFIDFLIKNSCSRAASGPDLNKKHSGFGLESVRKRLALLYENKYALQIRESDTEFLVHLKLTTR